MKAYIDERLRIQIAETKDPNAATSLEQRCILDGALVKGESIEAIFTWPLFFQYVETGDIFETFPLFEGKGEILDILFSQLTAECEHELLIRLYDQVFVECLTNVKALPISDVNYLLEMIERRKSISLPGDEWYEGAISSMEKKFTDTPSQTMHDLILYLAWDRVCVSMAKVFEYVSLNNILEGLNVLKECLTESFQHIALQGKTRPSFYRFMEALYAYHMREENLQKHHDEEWDVLCKGVSVLQHRERLVDTSYVDAFIMDREQKHACESNGQVRFITIESKEKMHASMALADLMLRKLTGDFSQWRFVRYPAEIIFVGN